MYSRTSFIYKYKTSTLAPFVKPCNVHNLAVQNIFYLQMYVESDFQGWPNNLWWSNLCNIDHGLHQQQQHWSSTPNPQSAKVERTKKFSRRRQQLLSNALFSVGPILVIECKNDWRSFLRNCNIANLRSLAIVILHFFMARIRRKWLHASVTRWLHNDFIFDQLQLAQCIRRLPK